MILGNEYTEADPGLGRGVGGHGDNCLFFFFFSVGEGGIFSCSNYILCHNKTIALISHKKIVRSKKVESILE